MIFTVGTPESRAKRRKEKDRKLEEWRRCYAIVPTRIGTDENGKAIFAWFEWVEERIVENTVEDRLPGSGNSYKYFYLPEEF